MFRFMLILLLMAGTAYAQNPGVPILNVGGGDGDPVNGGATIEGDGDINTDGNVDANSYLINGTLIQLGDMSNVDLTGLSDNDVIQYNSGTGNFEPVAFGGDGIGDLSDVTITSATTGDFIYYNGASWVNSPGNLSRLLDVDTTGVSDQDVLYYVNANSQFEPFDYTVNTNTINIRLANLEDVNETGITNGQILVWDTGTSKFIPGSPTAITALNDLSDVTLTSPIDRAPLVFDNGSGQWIDDTFALPVFNATTPGNRSYFRYDNGASQWIDDQTLEIAQTHKITFVSPAGVETDLVTSSLDDRLVFGDLTDLVQYQFQLEGGTAVTWMSNSVASNDNTFTFQGDMVIGRELFPSQAEGIRAAVVSTPLRLRSFADTAELNIGPGDTITVVDGSFGLGNATEIGNMFIAGPSGNDRFVQLYSGAVSANNLRASFGIDDTAEGGSDTGSRLVFNIYDDNGLNEVEVLGFDRDNPAIATTVDFTGSGVNSSINFTNVNTTTMGNLPAPHTAGSRGIYSDGGSLYFNTDGVGHSIYLLPDETGDVYFGNFNSQGIDEFQIYDLDNDLMLDFGKESTVANLDIISNDSNALDEVVGRVRLAGADSGAAQTIYAQILAEVEDATDTSEDGEYKLQVMDDGSLADVFTAKDGVVTFNWTTVGDAGSTLDSLSDTDITSVASNDILQWNGTDWENRNDLTINSIDMPDLGTSPDGKILLGTDDDIYLGFDNTLDSFVIALGDDTIVLNVSPTTSAAFPVWEAAAHEIHHDSSLTGVYNTYRLSHNNTSSVALTTGELRSQLTVNTLGSEESEVSIWARDGSGLNDVALFSFESVSGARQIHSAQVILGEDDVEAGVVTLYGANTAFGGTINLYAAATGDTDNETWALTVHDTTGDFEIRDATPGTAFQIDASTNEVRATTGSLAGGIDDTTQGVLKSYGNSAAGGGQLAIYNSASEDTTYEHFIFEASGSTLNLGPNTNTDAFTFGGDGTLALTEGLLNVGVDDTTAATLNVYGNNTTTGGQVRIYNAASEDTTTEYFSWEAEDNILMLVDSTGNDILALQDVGTAVNISDVWNFTSLNDVTVGNDLIMGDDDLITLGDSSDVTMEWDTTGQFIFAIGGTVFSATGDRLAVTEIFNTIKGAEQTIATGAITATASYFTVDTEADAATDDLATINGGGALAPGDFIIIQAASNTRTVVLKDGTGNLRLNGDRSLTHTDDVIFLIWDGSQYNEVAFSDNAA